MDSLVSVMGELKRGLMQITIGRDFSTRHMAEVSRKYNIPVTWTALLSHLYGPGGHRKQLDLAAEQRKSGALVIPQVSCRPLNFEVTFAEPFIFDVMPFMNELAKAEAKGAGRPTPRLRRSGVAREAAQRSDSAVPETGGTASSSLGRRRIASSRSMPLTVAAAKLGKDPVDLALDISLADDLLTRFRMAVMNFDEKEVAELITDPHTIIALSDAGAHASQLCDACYSTHLLGHWVRETEDVFTVEEAVHNLTQRPAEMFGITDRGVLAEGRPGRRRGVRSEDREPRPAEARLRPAGRRRPPRVRGERHRCRRSSMASLIRQDNKDTVAADDKLPGRSAKPRSRRLSEQDQRERVQ
jgi:N-acyl-D-amino-acid deacylase